MNQTIDLNLDSKTLEACLKKITNLGSITYQNICTGESVTVNWGLVNWAEMLLASAFFIALTLFLFAFGKFILKEL